MFDDNENDFFGDADYEGMEVQVRDPDHFNLLAGTHTVVVETEFKEFEKGGVRQKAFLVKFKCTEEGKQHKEYTEFLNQILPEDHTRTFTNARTGAVTSMAQIKAQQRVNVFGQLGVPQKEIKNIRPGDLDGMEGRVTLSKGKKGYIQFVKFVPSLGGKVGSPLRQAEPKPVTVSASASSDSDLGEFGI